MKLIDVYATVAKSGYNEMPPPPPPPAMHSSTFVFVY